MPFQSKTCKFLHELSGAAAEARRQEDAARRAREEEQRKRAEEERRRRQAEEDARMRQDELRRSVEAARKQAEDEARKRQEAEAARDAERRKAGRPTAWTILAVAAVLAVLIPVIRYSSSGTPPDTGYDTRPMPTARVGPREAQPPTVVQPSRPPEVTVTTGKQEPGDVQTVDLGGGVTLELVWIPPGTFMMGSPSSEAERDDDETQHQVTLTQGFWMGKYEVTQEQWERVMGNNPSNFKGDARLPVEQVSWEDCQEFIDRLNSRVSGGGFRLPTEAQWEYACRAGSKTAYYFGGSESGLADYACYTTNSGSKTHSVGQKRPNGWGLLDMGQRARLRKEKLALLEAMNEELNVLRLPVRLSVDLGCLGTSQYEYVSLQIDEIGRQLGGWIKQQRAKA